VKNKGIFVSLAVMLLWGLLFPLVKLGYSVFGIEGVGSILTFAGARFTVCGALITAFAAIKCKDGFKGLGKNIAGILGAGLFSIILHYACTYTGLAMTEGGKTAIIKQIGAVLYICFGALFFKEERLTIQKLGGLLLGILGIIAINFGSGKFTFSVGDLLIIGASFCTVFANVISKKALTNLEPLVLTGVSQLFGGVVLLCVGAAAGGDLLAAVPKTAPQIGIFAAIVAASVVSYCVWFMLVQKENLSKLFIIKFSEPLFASIFGWLIRGENIWQLNYLFAFLLISGGITVANIKKKA
jgi:drug/metabolite transporter (DMT)-like permease